jgi:predicted ATPase
VAPRLARGPRRERGAWFLRAGTLHQVADEAVREGCSESGWTDLHRRSRGESLLWAALERFHPGARLIERSASGRKRVTWQETERCEPSRRCLADREALLSPLLQPGTPHGASRAATPC